MEPSRKPASSEESESFTEGHDDDEDRLDGERSSGIWVEGEGELKGQSQSETVSLAAQLIARLVGLSTSRRPAPKTATHAWPQERWRRGRGSSGHGQYGGGHGYANVQGRRRGGYHTNGWRRSNILRPLQNDAAQWRRGGNPLGKMGYGHHGYGNYHHGGNRYYRPHGYGQIHSHTRTMPRMNQGLPSMNQQLPRAQAPSIHGLYPQGLRHSVPRVKSPHFNDMKIPHGPRMPNSKVLPRMYSPGMPNAKLTLDMLGRMLKEGKIPPINFNCNSNNHILHLVKQNSRKDDKKKKKRRRKRRAAEDSGSYSKEESGEENSDDEKKTSVEGKSIIPLLKRVEAKDVHALSHQLQPGRYGYGRPVIHHHGPRVILVCISNTYLQTLIKKNSGSDSD